MEHTCKLCFRRFANGRALGGHMRSHVTSATPPAKAQVLHNSYASSTSASSREAPVAVAEDVEEAGGDEDGKGIGLCYGLRENPRKSFRLVDPEFSSSLAAVDAGSSSVVQDWESETESSRAPPSHRRRSKRARRALLPPLEPPELEPASSVSDTTPEENVALSLVMLSRDFWTKTKSEAEDDNEKQRSGGSDEEDEAVEEKGQIVAGRLRPRTPSVAAAAVRGRSKHQCGTCKKVFRSYQALGGHRASHKRSRGGCIPAVQAQIHDVESSEGNADQEANKVHECPCCFRVFGSGQALGGHKRSHLASSSAAAATTITTSSPAPFPPPPPSPGIAKCGESFSFIDLNLPAPSEDDAEFSAVSDAEFFANYPSN